MKRKALSLALALVLVLALLPTAALGSDSDFVIEDGVLTKYNGPGGDVVIPDGVTKIGHEVFEGCTSLTSVAIGNGVTHIGASAFNGCIGLTSIAIPSSVTTIANEAFKYCTGLTSVTIPNGVTRIYSITFFGCTGLTSITIPESVTSIGAAAFGGCTGMTDVYYGGSETQWNAIDMGEENDPLQNATIHYNSGTAAPAIVSTGIDPLDSGTAKQSTQPVNIGGVVVQLQAYALVDDSGSTNYVKIRDVAAALDGTASQFNVDWDGAVNLVTGSAYSSRNGQENQTPYSGDRPYTKATADTKVNGVVVPLQAFILLDDNGNGSTYYKLRDLGQALGFNVGWDKDRGIFLEPGVPYDANN